jgi:hypothetical protein
MSGPIKMNLVFGNLRETLLAGCEGISMQTQAMKRLVKEGSDKIAESFRVFMGSLAKLQKELPSSESMKCIRSRVMLMKYQLDPPSVDGRRGKKRACLTDEEALLRAFAIDAFHLNRPAYIKPWIDRAIAAKDPEVFKMLAKVAEELKTPSHTTSSRRVMRVLEAEISLIEKLGRIPTKQEIQVESGMKMEPQRWTEIHKAAGQAKNPAGKPKRGQERRGDNRLKKPPKK